MEEEHQDMEGDSVFEDKMGEMERKMGQHESEIILLKAALSDALSRLNHVEEELKKALEKSHNPPVVPPVKVAASKVSNVTCFFTGNLGLELALQFFISCIYTEDELIV